MSRRETALYFANKVLTAGSAAEESFWIAILTVYNRLAPWLEP